jgi:hypothetical protein
MTAVQRCGLDHQRPCVGGGGGSVGGGAHTTKIAEWSLGRYFVSGSILEGMGGTWLITMGAMVYPGIFFRGGGGVQHIQLRTEGKGNGDLGAVVP